jgi:DNA end-binding protein Ku
VLEFVPARQIDPILYAHAYFLEPDHTAVRPYALFREALRHSGRIAIVKIALRGREHLAALRVRGRALILHTLLWPDELREPESPLIAGDVTTPPGELALAGELVDLMSADFHPADYTDDYREALREVVDAKISGREVIAPWKAQKVPVAGEDLATALEDSVHLLRDKK